MTPGPYCIVVSHDPWCPMSYGEGTRCADGCKPIAKTVDEPLFSQIVARDFRNRARRKAEAKRAKQAGGAR